jgi:5-methylcytosine-specific restriction endonuclease McrA
MSKRPILKLNANFFPLGTSTWTDTIVNIFSGAAHPLDIEYGEDEQGNHGVSLVQGFSVVKNWKEWSKLNIRACDDYVHTTSGPVRLPSVVVCSKFNKVIYKRVQFPTKQNIYKRDDYICGYTGKKLQKHELSIDHILPISRGGGNTWENLITCDKQVNNFKDNRLPQECGLKLLWKPERPKNGMVFDALREDWEMFVKAGA